MISHTPGPWNVESDDADPGVPFIPIYDRGSEKRIAQVDSTFNEEKDEFEITENDRANANLIAAAPEMLDKLVKVYKALVYDSGPEVYISPDLIKEIEQIIKKANGEL